MKSYLLIAFLTVGCTGQLAPRAPFVPSNRCESLDATHRTWGAIAKFGGVVAGAGGIATLPIDSDEKTLRGSVAISALAVGALAAAAVYIEQDAASSYARDCAEKQWLYSGE